MNLNHFFKVTVILLVGAVLLTGLSGAVTVEESDLNDRVEVDTEVELTLTLTELYQNPTMENWTLEGTTELNEPTWTITTYDGAGNQISQESRTEPQIAQNVSIVTEVSEITVRITGDVPAVEDYQYDPPQSFVVAEIDQVPPGGSGSTISTVEGHHYTSESQDARESIDDAAAAIEGAGDPESAQESLQSAILAYDEGNFDNAVRNADRAAEEAGNSAQRSQTMTLLLYGGGAILLTVAVVGGFFWYRQQQTASKL